MTKSSIEFDTDNSKGQAIMGVAFALDIPVLDVKGDNEQQACPVLPPYLNTPQDIMNLQAHVRCKIQNVEKQLNDLARTLGKMNLIAAADNIALAKEHVILAADIVVLDTRKLLKKLIDAEQSPASSLPSYPSAG